jgi:hypothetical protein
MEGLLNIRSAIAAVIVLLVVHRFIIEPAILSPLAKIPNAHWSSSLSPIWILSVRKRYKELQTIHKAHQRLGPVIRLGPNEVSVNCVDGGIKTIYSGGFEKDEWYAYFANYGYGDSSSLHTQS